MVRRTAHPQLRREDGDSRHQLLARRRGAAGRRRHGDVNGLYRPRRAGWIDPQAAVPGRLSTMVAAIREVVIEIVPYDPRWPAAFEAEAVRLRDALGPLAVRIDHNGSTAVPGLAA